MLSEAGISGEKRRRLLALKSKRDKLIAEFLKHFPKWKSRRCNYMRSLNELGVADLHEVQKNTDIARIVGGGAGIAGGTAAIAGILAAPFTFGISLALTVGGFAVGVAGSATAIGALAVRLLNEKWTRDAFVELTSLDLRSSVEVQRLVGEIHVLSEKIELEVDRLSKIFRENPSVDHKSLISSVRFVRCLSAITYVDSVAQLAVGAGRMASRAIGVVFAGLGIAVDAIDIGFAAHSIFKGSKNDIAVALQQSYESLQRQEKEYTEFYNRCVGI